MAAPGPALESRRALLEYPRVHRLTAEPDVVERQRAERELGDEHRTGVIQSLHDCRVRGRHPIAERFGAVHRQDVFRVEQIFHAVRHAVERAAVLALRDFSVGLLRTCERVVLGDGDDRTDLRVEPRDSLEINCVSRADVSVFDSIQRDNCVTGANAIASSDAGSGDVSGFERTKRSRAGPDGIPGSIGFQSVAGASVAAIATFLGPVRRSRYGAIALRHESTACCRSAGVIATCMSFSASTKVVGVMAGPTPGAVANAGGAPGVVGVACAGGADAGGVSLLHAAAATRTPSGA